MDTSKFDVIDNVLVSYGEKNRSKNSVYERFGYSSYFWDIEENEEVLEIPENLGITEIGEDAFNGCKATKIIIPEGVVKINKAAFASLSKLREVVFPSSLEIIGEDAFRNCPNLKTIHFSTGLKIIEEDAFCDNSSLEYINIPEGVIEIGKGAFRDNAKLREAILPQSLEKIGIRLFEKCKSLIKANVPEKIKEIPDKMFYECVSLEDVSFAKDITSIGFQTFGECIELNPFEIPNTVKSFGGEEFGRPRARGITGARKFEELRLPNGLKYIGDYDLYGLTGLKRLYIPLSVEGISYDVCEDSEDLEFIEMPFGLDCSSAFSSSDKPRQISFIYLDDNKQVKNILVDMKSFNSIVKCNDRYVIHDREKNIIVVSQNKIERYSISDLLKITNSNDEYELRRNYEEQTKNGRYDIINKWYEMIKKSGQSEQTELPQSFVLHTIPFAEEEIKRYYQRHKLFDELLSLSNFDKKEQKSDLLKLCYSIGLFSGNKEESIRAYNFIKKNIENGLLNGDYVHFTYDTFDLKNGYNPIFAEFYIKSFAGNYDTFNRVSLRIYNEFKKILKEFKKQNVATMDMSFVMNYLINHKYEVRYGNEMLAEEIKKYIDSYSSDDFEVMQDLFEKARKIAEKQSKKIADTTDDSKGYTYFWSSGDNPVNMILGNAVNCCARYNGAGQGIMEASMFDASVRNLIIYNKDKQIVGKATAYYNTRRKYILFNNAEMSQSFQAKAGDLDKKDVLDTILRAIKDQVEILNSDPNKVRVKKVVMGMRYNDLDDEIYSRDLPIITKEKAMLPNFHFTVSTEDAYEYEGDATDPSYGQVVLWKYEKKNERKK